MHSFSLKVLAFCLIISFTTGCTPSIGNRCRSLYYGERRMKCSDHEYSCNIADLTQDGKVLGGEKVTTLGGSCEVSVIPHKYGFGVSACVLKVKGKVSRTTEVSFSTSGEASFTKAVTSEGDTSREFRFNCAAWCGDVKETDCSTRDCSGDLKWSRNTYQRCYGQSGCSISKCITRRDLFGFWPGCQGSDDYWYGHTATCSNLC